MFVTNFGDFFAIFKTNRKKFAMLVAILTQSCPQFVGISLM